MARPTTLLTIKRKRGNPNWGKPLRVPPIPTEFEIQVKRIGLTKAEYSASRELRRWCEHNRTRVYVPEWLLDEWGITVNVTDVS